MKIIDTLLGSDSIPPPLLLTAITLSSMTQKKTSLLFTLLSFASRLKNYVSPASSHLALEPTHSSFRCDAEVQGCHRTLAFLQVLRYTFAGL